MLRCIQDPVCIQELKPSHGWLYIMSLIFRQGQTIILYNGENTVEFNASAFCVEPLQHMLSVFVWIFCRWSSFFQQSRDSWGLTENSSFSIGAECCLNSMNLVLWLPYRIWCLMSIFIVSVSLNFIFIYAKEYECQFLQCMHYFVHGSIKQIQKQIY